MPGEKGTATRFDAPASMGAFTESTQRFVPPASGLTCCHTKPGDGLTQLTMTFDPANFAVNRGAAGSWNAFAMDVLVPSSSMACESGSMVALTLFVKRKFG